MSSQTTPARRRILLIDDNVDIHTSFRKLLLPETQTLDLAAAKAELFGTPAPVSSVAGGPEFELEAALQGQLGVEQARTAQQADRPFMVAFVDMRMPPGWDGLTTIEQLWRADPRIQVVICTAYTDHSLDEISQRLGKSDRLMILKKPFDNVEVLQLARTLSEKWIAERMAAWKLEELEHIVQTRTAEIEHALLHDKLTDLPNRTLILSRLEQCIQRRRRNAGYRYALLFLDFDRFKVINDSLGHEIGDLVLIEVASRLRQLLRATDALARISTPSRIGGDEFLVLLEDLREEQDAARVAERILAALAEPILVNEQQLQLTCSVGIATSKQGYDVASDVIRDADTAMYRAKAAGRARHVMFDDVMHAQMVHRLSMEQELRKALQNGALDVHFQPIVALRARRITGFEALLRWQHPQFGLAPASEVVALAEDTGLIQPISLCVLRRACEQLRLWQQRATRPDQLMMSVNLSRRQLIDPELVTKIGDIVRASGIAPGTLVLEITESMAMADDIDAGRVLQELSDLGIWLHLDDFGTGYSSLSCLYRMPLSGIKIDRTFIRDVFQRPEHRVVLEAIVLIAKAFQLQVVAEGVETTEQLGLLEQLGVDHAQGYLFGQPVSAADTTDLLGEPAPLVHACERAFA